jgi:hypothetical protein
MYCKRCRERMMANAAWTEAHAKRQSELITMINEQRRTHHASLSVEEKEARRARRRETHSRNRDTVNAARRQRRASMKLDPVKYKAFRQKINERRRKHAPEPKAERERKRARTSADDDDDEDEKSTDVQSVILGDNVIVISDDEDEVAVADDSSGSDVEGIEFISSDDEQ